MAKEELWKLESDGGRKCECENEIMDCESG